MIEQIEIKLSPRKRGFHLITGEISSLLPTLPKKGLLNLFIKHTSCALAINENADPDVRLDLETIFNGIELDGERIEVDAIDYTANSDGTEVGIEIHSGQNRVVRRLFESLNYRVDKLDRVYFAGLTKKNLPRGTWRFLEPKEISMLKMGRF